LLWFSSIGSIVQVPVHVALEADPRPRAVVLDLESTDALDVPACDALSRLAKSLADASFELALARVRPGAQVMLDRSGVVDAIGAERVFTRVEEAVRYFAGASSTVVPVPA
jgi:MFS superfamily sulfate permease-like transporter